MLTLCWYLCSIMNARVHFWDCFGYISWLYSQTYHMTKERVREQQRGNFLEVFSTEEDPKMIQSFRTLLHQKYNTAISMTIKFYCCAFPIFTVYVTSPLFFFLHSSRRTAHSYYHRKRNITLKIPATHCHIETNDHYRRCLYGFIGLGLFTLWCDSLDLVLVVTMGIC